MTAMISKDPQKTFCLLREDEYIDILAKQVRRLDASYE